MKEKLLVLGSVNADLSITTAKFPKKGETLTGSDFQLTLGGKGANQAFYTSQLNINTTMISSIGRDYFGQFVIDKLNQTPINLKTNLSTFPTGKAVIILSENDNRIILDQGANYDFNIDQVEAEINLVQPDYLLSQLEIPFQVVYESFQFAKSQKITTILNPAPANITNQAIYQYVDYLILNESECETLTNLKFENSILKTCRQVYKHFSKLGVKNLLITLGEQGSFFKNDDYEHFQSVVPINVVNTTGAGDAYIGAFISKLLTNNAVKTAMKFATYIASEVCKSSETQVILTKEQKEYIWKKSH